MATASTNFIAPLLGLAQVAGRGQGYREQQQSDMQFLDLVNRQKASADAAYARQIQTALNAQLGQAQLQQRSEFAAADDARQQDALRLSATRAAQDDVFRQNQLAAQGQQNAIDNQIAFQSLDIRRDQANRPQSDDTGRALAAEYRRLQSALRIAEKRLKDTTYDELDDGQIARNTQASERVKGAIAGSEELFLRAKQQYEEVQRRMQEIDAALASQTEAILPQADIDPAVVQQIIAAQQGGNAVASGGGTVINTQAEYDKLPSGAVFTYAQDGRQYQKP